MRLVFFDLETGGLDPRRHPIIQLAAVAVGEQLEELGQFEAKILFDVSRADPQALAMNCYDAAVWKAEGIPAISAVQQFSQFLRPYSDVRMTSQRGVPYVVAQLAGYNAATFDGPFLQKLYSDCREFMPAAYRVLCVMQRAIWFCHERPATGFPLDFKLGTVCRHWGVPLADAHDALADCRATVALYRRLVQA